MQKLKKHRTPEELDEIKILCIWGSKNNLTRRETAERFNLNYDTVSKVGGKLNLKYKCGRQVANARRAKSIRPINKNADTNGENIWGSDTSNSTDNGPSRNPSPETRYVETMKKLKETDCPKVKIEIAYAYKFYEAELMAIKERKRPDFPKNFRM